MKLQFTSVLDISHKAELEELLFVHPQQERYAAGIVNRVEKHGAPKIMVRQDRLRVEFPGAADIQTLYAVMGNLFLQELVGIVNYTRTPEGALVIIHIAVKEAYTQQGAKSGQQVTLLLIQALCRIAQQIQGVQSVQLGYKHSHNFLKTDLFRSAADESGRT